PQLAANIGGVQRPLIIAPDAAGNFPFGRFTEEEWKQIRLSSPKPQILLPRMINELKGFDDLRLESRLEKALRDASFVSARGGDEARLVYIEAAEMVDAIRPSGLYKVDNGKLVVNVVLVRNNEQFGEKIILEGSPDESEEMMERLVEEIVRQSTLVVALIFRSTGLTILKSEAGRPKGLETVESFGKVHRT
ncbi:MAG TPA: hypothetical protein VMM38_00790, partial [Aridibacter sp.]|nr:hypothetical protein [Aridibacter sp.]